MAIADPVFVPVLCGWSLIRYGTGFINCGGSCGDSNIIA